MSTIRRQLIGFDVRCDPNNEGERWPTQRRRAFLLRPEIPYPLSVDRAVWASRFAQRGHLAAEGVALVSPNERNLHHLLFDLFGDRDDMISQSRPSPGDCGVAVVLLADERRLEDPGEEWLRAIVATSTRPGQPESDWVSLGFDVANSAFESALCNLGGPEAVERRRLHWSAALNPWGLFSGEESASAFMAEVAEDVPEQGPFYVFELLLMWGQVG